MKYKRIWLLLLLPISVVLLELARRFEYVVEVVYSRIIYLEISNIISIITGWVPFSLMEISLILFPFILIGLGIGLVVRIKRNRNHKGSIIKKTILNLMCFISVVAFSYTLLCGINYHRYSFTYHSGLEIEESSVEELTELCQLLAEEAKAIRINLTSSSESNVVDFQFNTYKEMAKEAVKAMNQLGEQYSVLKKNYALPKPIIHSVIMSKMGITGIFYPFTIEANINTDVTEYTIPASMCHELAHESGFMREDEANYIAYLACKNSDNEELQYSGIMSALVYVGNQLYEEDKEAYQKIRERYSEEMIADLRADSTYWSAFEDTTIRQVSSQINDTYLKANNQNDGVKSYGRMVDLLLAEYRVNKESALGD